MQFRLLANYGVAYVHLTGGGSLPQVRCAAVAIDDVPTLVAVDDARRVLLRQPIVINGGSLRSAIPANLQLDDGREASISSAGCGCGSPLKSIDVISVLEEQ